MFIILFKQYKYVFTWSYEDLNTYDTKITQRVIPLEMDLNTFKKKIAK